MLFKNHENVLLIDLETSGLNAYLDKILEIGYISVVNGVVVEEGDVLIDWGIEIPEIIQELTGITKEEIDKDGITPAEAYKLIHKLLSTHTLTISHNALFDNTFLHHFLLGMCGKNGIEDYGINYFDSLTLVVDHVAAGKKPRKPRKNSKNYEEKMVKWEEDIKLVQSHKVDSICRFYGLELIGGHRALADIMAVYEILKAFKRNNPKIDLSFYINKFGYKKRWKINEIFYYPSNVELFVQGTNGERYILDAKEHDLFK